MIYCATVARRYVAVPRLRPASTSKPRYAGAKRRRPWRGSVWPRSGWSTGRPCSSLGNAPTGCIARRQSPRDAARIAVQLAWDYRSFRGEAAVATGWLERAHDLLANEEPSSGHGWLALREASVLLANGQLGAARDLTSYAVELGRSRPARVSRRRRPGRRVRLLRFIGYQPRPGQIGYIGAEARRTAKNIKKELKS
jgi:hypothetical protein